MITSDPPKMPFSFHLVLKYLFVLLNHPKDLFTFKFHMRLWNVFVCETCADHILLFNGSF